MKKKVITPNIVDGGNAIPLGSNYYYMTGRKHKTGGIDIGKNPNTGLEVEDGEIMHLTDNNVKVFSSVPFLNGKSPAQKVLGGDNPNNVFKQQENYKDKNNLNDDGSKNKKAMGGLSRNKDYGSKDKPYPKVNSKDFAGGGRSYPIPTKSDAIDALRLAGLHGRSDVKTKIYNKYPELKHKAKMGTKYNNELDTNTNLIMNPSTGESERSEDNKSNVRTRIKKTANNVKQYISENPDNISSGLGLLSNLTSSMIGHYANRKMLNNIKYSNAPSTRTAAKLKTNININPQLDKMRESVASYEKDIDSNTSSSRVALARKQRGRLAGVSQINELYGNKENIETELINKDKLNQQAVSDANIRDYNEWSERKSSFDNAIREKKSENTISLIDNINTGIQDVLTTGQKNRANKQNRLAIAAASPNVNPRILKDLGIKGITDKDIENWDKAYNKKVTKQ